MIFCSWFFFIVVNLFGNVSDFTNCDSIRMYFSVKRLFLFLENRFCRMEIDLEKRRTFWSVETWGNLRVYTQFKGSLWGEKIKKKWGSGERLAKQRREGKEKRIFFLLSISYMINISWVFEYLLKQLISSFFWLCSFPVSLFLSFAKTLSVLTFGKYIWQENAYDAFAGIQSRNSHPASQSFWKVCLLTEGPCWCCLELTSEP